MKCLEKHERDLSFYPCLTCSKEFKALRDLKQHIQDTNHKDVIPGKSREERLQFYLQDAYYPEKVVVSREDREKCRIIVDEHLNRIIKHVREEQKGGEIYNGNLVPSGSTATQTKIMVANEFDYNLLLAEPFVDYARYEGDEVKYQLKGSEREVSIGTHRNEIVKNINEMNV